MWTVVVNHL